LRNFKQSGGHKKLRFLRDGTAIAPVYGVWSPEAEKTTVKVAVSVTLSLPPEETTDEQGENT
jgi:hypothetical protein